ncbi:MAG TPA: hypothetical protein VL137_03005 [Polyangiaceae bacterium]|nr:hypothetical protein [Polyangiaceae bacterium]
MHRSHIGCAALVCGLLLGCNNGAGDAANSHPPPEPPRSPNANVMPTPLAEKSEQLPRPDPSTVATSSKHSVVGDETSTAVARPAINPTPLSALHAPQPDGAIVSVKGKETQLLTLRTLWSWPNADNQPLEPEADLGAIDAINKRQAPQITIDLHPSGAMRWRWANGNFPLPQGTELRARVANYGHILLWPDEAKFRNLPPGSLRAVLAEHRADATPLVLGSLRRLPGGKWLDQVTETSELTTSYGKLIIEQAAVEEAGIAGQLLCRTLVELIDASPTSPACTDDRLPVRAQFQFVDGGACTFSVSEMGRKADVPGGFAIPPRESSFRTAGLPDDSPLLVEPDVLGKLHSRDRAVTQSPTPHPSTLGLDLENFSPNVAYLILDRVRVAMLVPYRSAHLRDLRPGKYRAFWHNFFGGSLRDPELVEVPGRTAVGTKIAADAGAPH